MKTNAVITHGKRQITKAHYIAILKRSNKHWRRRAKVLNKALELCLTQYDCRYSRHNKKMKTVFIKAAEMKLGKGAGDG